MLWDVIVMSFIILSFVFFSEKKPLFSPMESPHPLNVTELIPVDLVQYLDRQVLATVEDITGSNRIQKSVRMLEPTDVTVAFDVAIDQVTEYEPYEERLETYVIPVVFAIIFFVGILGNGTLVVIFLRHRAMRNIPNT